MESKKEESKLEKQQKKKPKFESKKEESKLEKQQKKKPKLESKKKKKSKFESKKEESKLEKQQKKLPKPFKDKCKKGNINCLQALSSKRNSKSNNRSSELKNMYYKPESMGYFMGIEGNSVFSKKGFKKRCTLGMKYKKKNEIPIKNKKMFGSLMGKLPKLLYVSKEQEEECYDPEPKQKLVLSLGEKCIDDKQCKSFKCSSNKFLRIPGKCIKNESENLYSDGDFCLSDKECKKGLKCKKGVLTSKLGYGVCKGSSKNIKRKLLSLGDKSYENNSSYDINTHLKKYRGKRDIHKFLKSADKKYKNRNIDNVSQEEIEKNIIKNDDYYWKYMLDNKEKIDCINSSKCRGLSDNGICYKDKCINVYNKCDKDDTVFCLKNRLKASKNNKCCEYDSICLEDINDRTKTKINVCYPLEKYTKKLRNGHYCQVNSNCKSNKCSKTSPHGISKKCISPYVSSERKCIDHSDCTNNNIYSDDSDICVNKKCENLKEYKYDEHKQEYNSGDIEVLDPCLDSQQCVSKYCGTRDFRIPEFYKHLDYKLCIPKKDNKIEEKIENKEKNYRENIKFNIKDFNSDDYKNFNLEDYDCIFYNDNRLSYRNHNNKLIIFRKKNENRYKYYLGKLIINHTDNFKYNSDVLSTYEILYFKNKVSVNKNMFENFYVISDNKNNYFSRDFKKKGNDANIESGLENIFNKRFEVNNLFIFEYICYMIFGERIIVDNFDDAYDKYTNSDNKYFTLTDFNYNIYFNKSYTKKNLDKNEYMLYETHLKDDIFNLSLPFRFVSEDEISNVSKDRVDFDKISNKIRESDYIDLSRSDYNKIIDLNKSTKDELKKENHISYLKILDSEKVDDIKSEYSSDIKKFPEITQFSIFV